MLRWHEGPTDVAIASSNSTDLLWAAIEGRPSVGGFGTVVVPDKARCFVVVMASCTRDTPSGKNHYYAHMGSLYLVADRRSDATTAAIYRPTRDVFSATGSVATSLTGRFQLLPHPAPALEEASFAHSANVKKFLKKRDVAAHGLIAVSGLVNFYGYSPVSRFSFNSVVYRTAEALRFDWTTAVNVAQRMLRCTAAPEAYPPKLWRCVATLALTLLSGPYPLADTGENCVYLEGTGWTRSTDSRNHPAFGLFTNKDCDGKAWVMCEYFYLLKACFGHAGKPALPPPGDSDARCAYYGRRAADAMLSEFSDAYMVSLMVNGAEVDGTQHAAPSGHCMVFLAKAPGVFANGTFVASCNMITNFWPPETQTLGALFPGLTFLAPASDLGGYFYVKPSNLSLYLDAVFFVGRDGAYAASGRLQKKKGKSWNPSTLCYDGPPTACVHPPYSLVSILMGCSEIVKLPDPVWPQLKLPAFSIYAEDVKAHQELSRAGGEKQIQTQAAMTPIESAGTVYTLAASTAADTNVLRIGMGEYVPMKLSGVTFANDGGATFRDAATHPA